jgi:hypothetical protein
LFFFSSLILLIFSFKLQKIRAAQVEEAIEEKKNIFKERNSLTI